jgi:serine/threonine protein kinase
MYQLEWLGREICDGVLSLSDFDLCESIGSGGFGKVVRAVHRRTGKVVAIKLLFTDDGLTQDLVDDYCHEVTMLFNCRFPFILALHGFTVQQPLAIVMPLLANGSLFNYTRSLRAKGRLTGTQKTLVAIGIAFGMAHLHSANIIHRDLKSLNVLLDGRMLPFVCDFGIARTVCGKNTMTVGCGTTFWMAPEQMVSRNYDFKVDVYAFGMVLYEMLCEKIPFEGCDSVDVADRVCRGVRPKLPSFGNRHVRHLIRKCWQQEPGARPTFEQIFNKLIRGNVAWDGTDPKAIKAMRKLISKSSHKHEKRR